MATLWIERLDTTCLEESLEGVDVLEVPGVSAGVREALGRMCEADCWFGSEIDRSRVGSPDILSNCCPVEHRLEASAIGVLVVADVTP